MGIIQQNSRFQFHNWTGSGVAATVPSQEDFTSDVSPWLVTDLVDGEIGFNSTDEKVFVRIGGSIKEILTDATPIDNIGSSDLTIDSPGTRKLIMNGALSTDDFSIRNSSDTHDGS